jgi:hypothetical protein
MSAFRFQGEFGRATWGYPIYSSVAMLHIAVVVTFLRHLCGFPLELKRTHQNYRFR